MPASRHLHLIGRMNKALGDVFDTRTLHSGFACDYHDGARRSLAMATKRIVGLLAVLGMALGLSTAVRAETLTVGGTGSSGPLIERLFAAFQAQAPEATLHLIAPPLGTNGALKAMQAGRIDLTLAGRPLEPEELARYGRHFDLADTPFVMASKDGVRQNGFSLEELAAVYAGSLQTWDSGAPIRLVIRGSFESDTLLLKTMSPGLALAVDAAGKRPGMAGAVNDIETASLIAGTPGSLGPTTLGLLTTMDLRPVLFPINGVEPSLASLRDGRYPWRKSLTVILPLKPSPLAARFADYLRSPEARAVMERCDYLPVAR
jgi:phosphate transport system substrate-binding protein